jgi:hypothetical protein
MSSNPDHNFQAPTFNSQIEKVREIVEKAVNEVLKTYDDEETLYENLEKDLDAKLKEHFKDAEVEEFTFDAEPEGEIEDTIRLNKMGISVVLCKAHFVNCARIRINAKWYFLNIVIDYKVTRIYDSFVPEWEWYPTVAVNARHTKLLDVKARVTHIEPSVPTI